MKNLETHISEIGQIVFKNDTTTTVEIAKQFVDTITRLLLAELVVEKKEHQTEFYHIAMICENCSWNNAIDAYEEKKKELLNK